MGTNTTKKILLEMTNTCMSNILKNNQQLKTYKRRSIQTDTITL